MHSRTGAEHGICLSVTSILASPVCRCVTPHTVPVAFPGTFRSKKRSWLVAAYLAHQSVAGVGVVPYHIWHNTSFIPTCVKSRSLPVNNARWQNHVTCRLCRNRSSSSLVAHSSDVVVTTHHRCQQCRLNNGLTLCTKESPWDVCRDWLPEA